jgi:valyl-tRNA synthetase
MPFVTEEIFCTIQDEEESIMVSDWPVYSAEFAFEKEEKEIETIKEAVRAIRNVRTGMNVAPSRKAKVFVVSTDADIRKTFTDGEAFFKTLSYASEIEIRSEKGDIPEDAVSVVIAGATLYLPFEDLVDIAQEIERLTKEKARLEGEIKRSNSMLSNEKFLSKAPKAKVDEEKEKLVKYESMLTEVTSHLDKIKK